MEPLGIGAANTGVPQAPSQPIPSIPVVSSPATPPSRTATYVFDGSVGSVAQAPEPLEGNLIAIPAALAAAAATGSSSPTHSPSRRPVGQQKPRPEPLDLPPISDQGAYVVPAEEQIHQRQQQQQQQQQYEQKRHEQVHADPHAVPSAETVVAQPVMPTTHTVPVLAPIVAGAASRPLSTTSNGVNRQFHAAHKKSHKTTVDIWFEYMIAISEVVFVAKLSLYEDSCALLLANAAPRKGKKSRESLRRSEKAALDILDRMQFRRPVKMRKQSGFLDAIEEEKEYVYEGLEEGYKVFDVDVDAVRHYGQRNGWLPSSRRGSLHHSPLAPPVPDNFGHTAFTASTSLEDATTPVPQHTATTQAPTPVPEAAASSGGPQVAAPSSPSPAPSASSEDDDDTTTTAAEVIEQTLLYGELSSVGVRQVVRVFHEAVMQDTCDDPYAEEYGTVVVGVDVGCGTGKMLFEWSRLATAQVQLDNQDRPERTPTDFGPSSHYTASAATTMGAGISGSEMPAALQHSRLGGSWRGGGGMMTQPLGGSPAGSLSTRRHQHYLSRMPADLAPPQNWSFSSVGAVVPPHASPPAPRSNMRGFLGVGMEVAPSRIFVARKAMSPNYLDLMLSQPKRSLAEDSCLATPAEGLARSTQSTFLGPREAFAVGDPDSAEETKKTLRHHTSVASTRSALPRYDPAPASAVAAPCPDPTKRRPAACVLLHEGDALSPGLLHNQTLFRFPPPNMLFNTGLPRAPASATSMQFGNGSFGAALSLGGMAAGLSSVTRATHAPARENYYRLCRVQRGPTPSGHEVPHLNVFCCGIGFDEPFVRALCTCLEGLLQPKPPDEPHTTTTAAEVLPHGAGSDLLRRSIGLDGPSSLSRTMMPTAATAASVTAINKASISFPKLLRPSALEHWKSITCILLLRDFDVEEVLKQPDFPLFSCCRRWHASTRRVGSNTEGTTSGERSAVSTPAPQFAPGSIGEGSIVGIPEVLGEYEDRSVNVPGWCTSRAGLRDSSIRLTHVETTWMTKAPAWVLNFRF